MLQLMWHTFRHWLRHSAPQSGNAHLLLYSSCSAPHIYREFNTPSDTLDELQQ